MAEKYCQNCRMTVATHTRVNNGKRYLRCADCVSKTTGGTKWKRSANNAGISGKESLTSAA